MGWALTKEDVWFTTKYGIARYRGGIGEWTVGDYCAGLRCIRKCLKRRHIRESGDSVRRVGDTTPGRDGIPAEAHGGNRWTSHSVAHHEDVRALWVPRFCFVPGVSRQHHQRVFPELRGHEQ